MSEIEKLQQLFHGTSKRIEVFEIDLTLNSLPCDFGNGFYTTPDYDEAIEWAELKEPRAIVINEYSWDLVAASKLSRSRNARIGWVAAAAKRGNIMSEDQKNAMNSVIDYFVDIFAASNHQNYADARHILEKYGAMDHILRHYAILGHARPEQIGRRLNQIVESNKSLRQKYSVSF